MKWFSMAGALTLLSAAAVFSGAVVFASTNVEKVETKESAFYDDNFMQEPEPGIAEILMGNLETSSASTSSGTLPPEIASSDTDSSGTDSSDKVTSQSSSASSKNHPSSSRTEESSAPVSSKSVSSAPVSSVPVSSTPVSSTPASSAVAPSSVPVSSAASMVRSPNIDSVSSEPVSSESESSDVVTSEEEEVDTEPSYENSELLDQIAGCVQREIIGVNTPPRAIYYEAYKAQAVAAHTYMEYHKSKSGSYPTMSYCTPMPQTLELVSEVLNEMVYYRGMPINASYHAASGGHTQSAIYVWGNEVPYLVGVESAYDDYDASYRISVSALEEKLQAIGVDTSSDPASWFDLAGASFSDGDFINTIDICGLTVSGRVLRENVLGTNNLKSPKITGIDCDGSYFTFYTKGYGHGAGLSQNGALGYAANEGWSYEQILTHYYVGTTVQ